MILSITRAFLRSARSCASSHERAARGSAGIRADWISGAAEGRVMYRMFAPAVRGAWVVFPTLDRFRL